MFVITGVHVPAYFLQVAPSLADCFPVAGPGNLLYIFVVHEVESGRTYLSLPNESSHTALGILTRKPLPHLKVECCSVSKYHIFSNSSRTIGNSERNKCRP